MSTLQSLLAQFSVPGILAVFAAALYPLARARIKSELLLNAFRAGAALAASVVARNVHMISDGAPLTMLTLRSVRAEAVAEIKIAGESIARSMIAHGGFTLGSANAALAGFVHDEMADLAKPPAAGTPVAVPSVAGQSAS